MVTFQKITDKKKRNKIWKGLCPECETRFIIGPRGGLSINVKCEKCNTIYNIPPRPFSPELIFH